MSHDDSWEQTRATWQANLEAWRATAALGQRVGLRAWTASMEHWAAWQRAQIGGVQDRTELFTRLAEEYRCDLEGLDLGLAPQRAAELARMATEIALGQPGPDARRYLERFADSVLTKAMLGPEVYTRPEQASVAPTPRQLVLEEGGLRLHRYGAEHPPGRPPIVLIYSVINRPWILDLVEGWSLVAHLLGRGLDVWMVEWREAEPGCSDTLDEYVGPWLQAAVAHVTGATGHRPVLLGQCIGGTIGLIHAALHPDDLAGLITLTTPITSTGSSILELWLDTGLFPLDQILRTHGCVPGKVIRASIMSIKPYLEVLKWKAFYESLHDDQVMGLFAPVDRWANDNPDVAGEVFRSFLDEVYRHDRLVRGETRLGGRRVDLARVRCPVLNLVAEEDWIVPPAGARRIVEVVGSEDARTVTLPGPHVGIILDARTRGAWDRIADFAVAKAAAIEHPPPPEAPCA